MLWIDKNRKKFCTFNLYTFGYTWITSILCETAIAETGIETRIKNHTATYERQICKNRNSRHNGHTLHDLE